MKLSSTLFIFVIFLTGCTTTLLQLYKTDAPELNNTGDIFVWENDSVGIEYSFWAERGVMSFSIYNKLDKPLYVDWKRSTYMLNSNKFDYWSDHVETTTVSNSSARVNANTYTYEGPQKRPFSSTYAVVNSTDISTSVTSKQERVTFIPPRTFCYSSRHYIAVKQFNNWGEDYYVRVEKRNDKPKKETTVYVKEFTKNTSPLVFRNFLTLSTNEDFSSEFYVDNEFFVKEVNQMDAKHFTRDTLIGNSYKPIYIYERGTDFYK